jgi:hypothetical protein
VSRRLCAMIGAFLSLAVLPGCATGGYTVCDDTATDCGNATANVVIENDTGPASP